MDISSYWPTTGAQLVRQRLLQEEDDEEEQRQRDRPGKVHGTEARTARGGEQREKGVEEGAGKAQAESEGRLDRERRRR